MKIPNQKDRFYVDKLFDKRKMRFCHTPQEESMSECLKVIIDDQVTIFFHKINNEWSYEGWEVGNYKDYWTRGQI
jgi:hypothetical protein